MSRLMVRRARRRHGLGATAIEYGLIAPAPIPQPPPPRSRLVSGRSTLGPRGRGAAPRVLRRPLGSLQSTYPFGSVQSTYAFGDDAQPMSEEDWRKAMLDQQKGVTSWIERWVKRDELQRWLQLGATLAIPLSAAIWKAIFRASGKSE